MVNRASERTGNVKIMRLRLEFAFWALLSLAGLLLLIWGIAT